jgi:hypothetical protein
MRQFSETTKQMKNSIILKMLGACALLAVLTAPVKAITVYDFTYTQVGETSSYGNPLPGTVTDATGTLDVSGNIVVSGTLTVTGTGPLDGTYILASATGRDSLVQYDNVWPIDTSAGLVWSVSGVPGNSPELNMWSTGSGEYGQPGGYYALWGGPAPANGTFSVETYGTATFIDPVPDGGNTAVLLGGALLGLQALRRKLSC